VPLDVQKLLDFAIDPVRLRLTPRDAMLYALGVGFGTDPLDPGQLRYVFEDGLSVVPTHVNQMAGGAWLVSNAERFGIAATGIMQAEQAFTIIEPLPPECDLLIETRVQEVADKGAGKSALILYGSEVRNQADNRLHAIMRSTVFCRDGGGFGGVAALSDPLPVAPSPGRAPDIVCDLPTLPQSALIYRLSGDYHRLHADPAFAQAAGFSRPILHGKCTMGVVGHALLRACCDYDASRLKDMACRFSAPVFPGETIRTEIWHGKGAVHFRAVVPQRSTVVLSHGTAQVEESSDVSS
jgi:acyl dehydratase